MIEMHNIYIPSRGYVFQKMTAGIKIKGEEKKGKRERGRKKGGKKGKGGRKKGRKKRERRKKKGKKGREKGEKIRGGENVKRRKWMKKWLGPAGLGNVSALWAPRLNCTIYIYIFQKIFPSRGGGITAGERN